MHNNITRYKTILSYLPYFLTIIWLLCSVGALYPQPAQELENYLSRIDTARQLQNYNLALKLLLKAQQKYPNVAELPFLSGELYEQQNLQHLGLESYLRAIKLDPQNTRYINRVASLQDRLGKYRQAVDSFRLLEQLGNSYERNEARRKNGWLLYKLHRYDEAEASILAIPPEERSSGIMMTLAIIYSAAYNYEQSRKAYEQSLALVYPPLDLESQGNEPNFRQNVHNSNSQRALVYYNYALLEADFRNFNRAMELNNKSIANISFPSNELLKGELYLQQHQFTKAKEAFRQSQQLEDQSKQPSPLALLDLVLLAIRQGKNTEGMIFLRELDRRFKKQTAWMTSYGIDPINFELELMDLRTALYKGLLQEQKWRLPLNTNESFQRLWGLLKYRWLYWYTSIRKKLLAYQVGKEHYQQKNSLDSLQNFYDASYSRSLVQRRFFHQLKNENLTLIPNSKGVLLLEEGILERSIEKIEQSLKLLDKKWDMEYRETAYIELSRLRQQTALRYQDLLNAYQNNRAALKLAGITLPLQLQISGSAAYQPEQQKIKKRLERYLRRSGAEIISTANLPVLRLQIQWSNEQVRAYLISEKGTVIDNIDSHELENIRTMRQENSIGTNTQNKMLKKFTRSFMQQILTPKR